MVHSSSQFWREAQPVVDFLNSICNGYYFCYEYDRGSYLDTESSDYEEAAEMEIDLTKVENIKEDIEKFRMHILYHVAKSVERNSEELVNFFRPDDAINVSRASRCFRNLSNAWRDEYAVNQPFDAPYEERMKNAEWRIVMCYYSIFKSTSAIMRIFEEEEFNGHQDCFNKHARSVLSQVTDSLYTYPYLFFPNSGTEFSRHYFDFPLSFPAESTYRDHLPQRHQGNIERAMNDIHEKGQELSSWEDDDVAVTFYDVMKLLREWANYSHGGIFSRLYGDEFRKTIDVTLRLLSYTKLTIAETALIAAFGFERFDFEFGWYDTGCETGTGKGAELVRERYQVYSQLLNDI